MSKESRTILNIHSSDEEDGSYSDSHQEDDSTSCSGDEEETTNGNTSVSDPDLISKRKEILPLVDANPSELSRKRKIRKNLTFQGKKKTQQYITHLKILSNI
jgi:hypothetical protein